MILNEQVPRTVRGVMARLKCRAPVRDKVPRTARGGMVRLRYRAPVNLKHTLMKQTIATKITPRQGVESYFKPL